jgi:transcriptional regulator with XRE-family HTH domain
LRDYHGFTQLKVAERLGISQAAYSRLEKGEVELSVIKLIALCEIYDVILQDLLKDI